MRTLWEKVTGEARLISLPDIYLRLKDTLEQEDFSMEEVTVLIGHDPGMTARLMRLVNSAFFGLAANIDTVNRAINLLGTQQVHDLVLATSVAEAFGGMDDKVMDMERFWRKSVACGVASRELATLCHVLDSERVFVCGLLRDIGHLVMYQAIPEAAQQALDVSRERGLPIFEVEREQIGLDYARVGGTLMRQWRLPRSLWEPTEFHVEPSIAREIPLLTALVHFGAILAEAMDSQMDLGEALQQADDNAWRITGLSVEQCLEVTDKVSGQIDGIMQLLMPVASQASA
jgi:HD-like signal output (HDOD) protein